MRDTMMGFGWLFFLGGLTFLMLAYVAPSAEPMARTVSIEMLADRIIYALSGVAATVTGAVWIAAVMLAPKPVFVPAPPAA